MEEKYYEQFWKIEQGAEDEGYVELKKKVTKDLKEIEEDCKLVNMYQRVKLKLDKYEKGIIGTPKLPFVKLIFSPLFSSMITLVTILFTFLNYLGNVFYNAGIETGEAVVTVVEEYGKLMIEAYKKGLFLFFCVFVVIATGYFIAYASDYKKQQQMKKNELYYSFMLEVIKEELDGRKI